MEGPSFISPLSTVLLCAGSTMTKSSLFLLAQCYFTYPKSSCSFGFMFSLRQQHFDERPLVNTIGHVISGEIQALILLEGIGYYYKFYIRVFSDREKMRAMVQ